VTFASREEVSLIALRALSGGTGFANELLTGVEEQPIIKRLLRIVMRPFNFAIYSPILA
jgi:hypothetical protein